MDLECADSLLALSHQVDDLKPSREWIVGILENRFRDDAETVSVAPAAILILADPVPRLRGEQINLLALAAWAFDAVRPAHIAQQSFARRLIAELLHQLSERDVGLSAERLASFNFLVHVGEYKTFNAECQAQHNPLPFEGRGTEKEGAPLLQEVGQNLLEATTETA
jgi:hypothetical protein